MFRKKSPSDSDQNLEKAKVPPGFFSVENLRSLAVLVIVILALRWSVASPYHVPTASMEPTIKVGDRLLAFKLAYNLKFPFTDWVMASWGSPKRGDIIVFKYPRDPDTDYVKRVVAVGGDRIQLINDILYVNDKPEPKVAASEADRAILSDIYDFKTHKDLYKEDLDGVMHWVIQDKPEVRRFASNYWPPQGSPPARVPENSVFVIGDNRDNSTDSRVWGEVPLDYVRGKAMFVIWSLYFPRKDDTREEEGWPVFRYNRIGHWLN